jgi:hypothetical protein
MKDKAKNRLQCPTGKLTIPEQLYPGQKVHYKPTGERGIIKSIPNCEGPWAFVVFNCDGQWDNYKQFTAASIAKKDLEPGWPLIDSDPMPYGKKHKGEPMEEVPASYLLWIEDEWDQVPPDLQKYINENRQCLEDKVNSKAWK